MEESLFRQARLACAIALALLLPAAGNALEPNAQASEVRKEPSFKEGEIIVRLTSEAASQAGVAVDTEENLNPAQIRSLSALLPELPPLEGVKKLCVRQEQRRTKKNPTYRAGQSLDGIIQVRLRTRHIPAAKLESYIKALQRNPNVKYAQPNYRKYAAALPNDPYIDADGDLNWSQSAWGQPYEDLWGLKRINAVEAWNTTRGEGVLVAVVDTGVDYNHPDIWHNIWVDPALVPDRNGDGSVNLDDLDLNGNRRLEEDEKIPLSIGVDAISGDGDPADDYGHGTHVAGTIAAEAGNGIGIAGVAPEAKILSMKGLNGRGMGDSAVLGQMIADAADLGARVINNSWGKGGIDLFLEDAVRYAHTSGAVVVFSAGNSSSDAGKESPQRLSEVISVAAADYYGQLASFSSWGHAVALAAPGAGLPPSPEDRKPMYGILSLHLPGGTIEQLAPHLVVGRDYVRLAGTSMAAPHVSGAAALILSAYPQMEPDQVKALLMDQADPLAVPDPRIPNAGMLNAARAIRAGAPLVTVLLGTSGTMSGMQMIEGTAEGPLFKKYSLYMRPADSSGSWKRIKNSARPAHSGVLMPSFNSHKYNDGDYDLKLVVFGRDRSLRQRISRITIDNFGLDVPSAAGLYRLGDAVPLSGYITGPHIGLRIDYGRGSTPRTWRSAGMLLLPHRRGKELHGLLGVWDTSRLASMGPAAAGGEYTIRMRVRYRNGWMKDYYRSINLSPLVKPGLSQTSVVQRLFIPDLSVPRFFDLDADGVKEVLYSDAAGLRVLHADGTLHWSLPIGDQVHMLNDAVAVGDLDGDGFKEVAVIGYSEEGAALHLFRHDGAAVGGSWPLVDTECGFISVAAADVNNDGRDELVASGWVFCSEDKGDFGCLNKRRVLVLDGTGRTISRFDVSPDDWPVQTNTSAMTIADLDSDGQAELLFPAMGTFTDGQQETRLYAYRLDGSPLPGWPFRPGYYSPLMSAPIAADINGDGAKEVIFTAVGRSGAEREYSGGIYALHADGSRVSGWPVGFGERYDFALWADGAEPVAADLNGDGAAEVILNVGDLLAVYDGAGTLLPHWPVRVGTGDASVGYSPTIGDIDGDLRPDIVLITPGSSGMQIEAYRLDGTEIDLDPYSLRLNLAIPETYGSAAVLDDMEGDGLLDLAVTGCSLGFRSQSDVRTSIAVFGLPVPAVWPSMQWPVYKHDNTFSGDAGSSR